MEKDKSYILAWERKEEPIKYFIYVELNQKNKDCCCYCVDLPNIDKNNHETISKYSPLTITIEPLEFERIKKLILMPCEQIRTLNSTEKKSLEKLLQNYCS